MTKITKNAYIKAVVAWFLLLLLLWLLFSPNLRGIVPLNVALSQFNIIAHAPSWLFFLRLPLLKCDQKNTRTKNCPLFTMEIGKCKKDQRQDKGEKLNK